MIQRCVQHAVKENFVNSNDQDPKFKIGDHVKNILLIRQKKSM